MEYIYQYLMFLGETVTVVVAILVILSAVVSLNIKRQHPAAGHLEIKKLNDSLRGLRDGVRQAVLDPASFKMLHKQEAKDAKKKAKKEAKESKRTLKQAKKADSESDSSLTDTAESTDGGSPAVAEDRPGGVEDASTDGRRPRVFVLDFKGDLQATKVNHLRTEITALLTMAEASDEVLLRLESPGGAVHGYGLAASQLDRIKQHGISLTAAVDKVAASGGYLMAAVADRILAAPFAVIGSIGVVAQVPNVHRLLKKHDVDVEVLTAGKYKRTLTVLGENTEEGRQKFVEELEEVHALFQEFVGERRPALNMDEVATGEAWYGQRALDKALVDEILTSDEYLTGACESKDVFAVQWIEHKKPIEKLLAGTEDAVARTIERFTRISWL